MSDCRFGVSPVNYPDPVLTTALLESAEDGKWTKTFFMTKSPRKNVPDVGIELGAACMPSGHASDRATTPGRTSAKSWLNK